MNKRFLLIKKQPKDLLTMSMHFDTLEDLQEHIKAMLQFTSWKLVAIIAYDID